MKPVVDGLQQEYAGRITFAVYEDVDADAEGSALADAHGVSAVPTMMLVSPDGAEVERWVGARPADELRQAFDEAAGGG